MARPDIQLRGRVEFDSAAITVPYDHAKARNLRRIAALTRRYAQESLTSKTGPASPGSPPHSHSGRLRNNIIDVVDQNSATVGPAEFSSRVGYSIPEILEFGGWVQRVLRQQRGRRTIIRRLSQHYRPHPYMRPAFDRAQRSWLDFWKDSLFGN